MLFTILDIIILFATKRGIHGKRTTTEKFSNGDKNPITVSITNYYTFKVIARIIDEIPEQFQVRNFDIKRSIAASSNKAIEYELRPTERGEYHFGKLNIYISSAIGLVSRRFIFDDQWSLSKLKNMYWVMIFEPLTGRRLRRKTN